MEKAAVMNTHSEMMETTDTVNLQNYSNITTFTWNMDDESEDVTKLAMSFIMYKIGKWVVFSYNWSFVKSYLAKTVFWKSCTSA